MIKIGEVYFDTVLETLFIVDAIGGSRVYLLELKERIDPRVVIEKPETIFKRYKLTNIGFQSESRIGYPHPSVNSMSIEHLADVDITPRKAAPRKAAPKKAAPKKAAPKKAAPKKVIKKSIQKTNKK